MREKQTSDCCEGVVQVGNRKTSGRGEKPKREKSGNRPDHATAVNASLRDEHNNHTNLVGPMNPVGSQPSRIFTSSSQGPSGQSFYIIFYIIIIRANCAREQAVCSFNENLGKDIISVKYNALSLMKVHIQVDKNPKC